MQVVRQIDGDSFQSKVTYENQGKILKFKKKNSGFAVNLLKSDERYYIFTELQLTGNKATLEVWFLLAIALQWISAISEGKTTQTAEVFLYSSFLLLILGLSYLSIIFRLGI